MKQSEFNRQVARATGESVDCIRQRGFSPFEFHSQPIDSEVETNSKWVDWDELDARRWQ